MSSHYRIGIDARIYGSKEGGIGRYVQEFVRALPQVDRTNTYVLFLRPQDFETFPAVSARIEKVCVDARPYTLAEQLHMPIAAHKARLDILHIPHVNAPYAWQGKMVVTVHDLIEYKYDRAQFSTLPLFLYRMKRVALQKIMHHTLTRADAIITVSRHTQKEVMHAFPGATQPYIIPHGILYKKIRGKQAVSAPLSAAYLLYIGSAAPHKNVERLIGAYRMCLERNRIAEHLVLVLPKDFHTARIQRMIAHFPRVVRERIHIKHDVDDRNLYAHITHAALVLSASHEEGYGLPFAEALALGTPVLAGFVGTLPELPQDKVRYWNTRHIPAMAKRLVEALHDASLAHGPSPAHQDAFFSWQETARRHRDIYRMLLSHK